MIWVRHGERADDKSLDSYGHFEKTKNKDAPLTENGIIQSKYAAELIRRHLLQIGFKRDHIEQKLENNSADDKENNNEQQSLIKVYSSPLLRTLQTASTIIGQLTNSTYQTLNVNNNLAIKLKLTLGKNIIEKGVLGHHLDKLKKLEDTDKKQQELEFIHKHLNNDVARINMVQDSQVQPAVFPEKEGDYKRRYKAGFKELIQKELSSMRDHTEQKVLILVSHHTAVDMIIQMFDKKFKERRHGYCYTFSMEIQEDLNSDGFSIKSNKILHR
eukprot:403355363